VSPGWLFRAGLASCAATCVGLAAADEGIELALLEVVARSRSDLRGLVGLPDAHGTPVSAASQDLALSVRIGARGVAPGRLRALAERGLRGSPVYSALLPAVPMALHIEVEAT
jgi:OsmC-like protein